MKKAVLATANPGKLREIRQLLSGLPLALSAQSEHGLSGADEVGATFIENALLKARHAAAATGLAAIADDSGLEVDILGGAPGIHSARYAGPGAGDADNRAKLMRALAAAGGEGEGEGGGKKFPARFRCVAVFLPAAMHPAPLVAEGVWHGFVRARAEGEGGFGYDPVFFVPQKNCSAAQLSAADKNQLSHRARAFGELKQRLAAAGAILSSP
ncbi:MAG: RdgB/HAM1 family non-canonical purine NTP pyrophosphatase [Gammaproteobacteria bacterium]|nr:RdgB/HAM1 family non-canonical purine NTP pyrophosphatase [Gammaproteobacteria bacterium]MDD9851343.1 RdgB/HAM1 family non-canonical purine NTP pyrophosphatase [Gammaproteobacteria bacterium]